MQLLLFGAIQAAIEAPLRAATRIIVPASRSSQQAPKPASKPKLKPVVRRRKSRLATTGPARPPANAKPLTIEQQRYEALTQSLLQQFDIEVRRYRQSLSGCAYEMRYRDGRLAKRCIEVPAPRTQLSLAVFLHEIGHHVIGFNRYKPRCLEEYHAWQYAIDQMQQHHIEIAPEVHERMRRSLRYAVAKATRRGLRTFPGELLPFVPEAANWPLRVRAAKR
jgi:hypothetical protein